MRLFTEPPKIQINELFNPSMALNGFSSFLSEPDTPSNSAGEYFLFPENYNIWARTLVLHRWSDVAPSRFRSGPHPGALASIVTASDFPL